MAYVDNRDRSPQVEYLPDLRIRVTREYDVLNSVGKTPLTAGTAMFLAWGTADVQWPQALLIKQDLEGQTEEAAQEKKPARLTRVYEQLNRTSETQVGDPEINIGQDGLYTIVLNYIQYSVAAGGGQTFQTVGANSISSPHAAVLKLEERTDDGTLQRIKRTYISAGVITNEIETKYDGALSIQTTVAVNQTQSPPSNYTLIDLKTDNVNGLPVYTYKWASGSGQISSQTEYRLSPDQGATGVTVVTIKYLSYPSVGASPITPPGGSEEISIEMSEQDGYRIWTGIYASGRGTISTEVVEKFDGNLTETTITAINTAPTGSGTLIKTDVRNGTRFEDGTVIYAYTWAVVTNGSTGAQIGIDTEYLESVDTGTHGITRTTIRQIVSPGSSIQPTSYGSAVLVKKEVAEFDGYDIWTTVWATGTGTVDTEVEMRFDNLLQITKIVAIGTAPSSPSPALGGTVVLISTDQKVDNGYTVYTYKWAEASGGATGARISIETEYIESINTGTAGITKATIRYIVAPGSTIQPTSFGSSVLVKKEYADAEGYGIWTTVWAIGTGTISSETETKEFGQLVVYRITAIGTAPSTPAATIGGTVVLIDAGQRTENGFVVFEYRWAEGKGVIDNETNIVQVGALVVYHILSLGVAPTTPSATLGGTVTLVEQKVRNSDGYQIYDYRWAEGKGQASLATRGMPDGAILYEVTTTSAAASTPPYPGSGTAYLVDLVQEAKEGYYLNRATWHLPPATLALSRTVKFYMPGQIEVQSSPAALVYVPPVEEMKIQVTETVSYSTTQDTTAPFTVEAWPSLSYSYIVASNGQTVTGQKGLVGYLSGATGASGSSSDFNGINCSSWSYTITSSTPSAPPSGSKVIENENTPYLTDIYGVVVFRIRKQTYSF